MSSLIKVCVLGEQEIVHYGLRACFSDLPDIVLTGNYYQANGALRAIANGQVDVLVMDQVFEIGVGLNLIRYLNVRHPKLRVLVFLSTPCPATVTLLLDTGVQGIVCKSEPLSVCVKAIRLLASGQHYLCTRIVNVASGSSKFQISNTDAVQAFLSFPSLSLREREVLRLYISGLTVTRIAALCHRSLKTVSTQKQAAYRKLGLKSDIDLFRSLARYGV